MNFYQRNLPHWQPKGAEYFITFRLAGSLPKNLVKELVQARKELLSRAKKIDVNSEGFPKQELLIQQKIFQKYESQLDKGATGPTWLSNESVAKIVKEALHYRDQTQYDLYAYCLMSNHVHLVFKLLATDDRPADTLLSGYPVTNLLKKLKSYTAVNANKELERSGRFWHRESYDRVIRDSDELERAIAYTLNNPVKANLIPRWEDWSHSYCKPEFLPAFSTKI